MFEMWYSCDVPTNPTKPKDNLTQSVNNIFVIHGKQAKQKKINLLKFEAGFEQWLLSMTLFFIVYGQ
jgi:hypothetical protein